MNADMQQRVRRASSDAASIAGICALMAEALCADPATTHTGEAVEGLRTLALKLSDDLCDVAGPRDGGEA